MVGGWIAPPRIAMRYRSNWRMAMVSIRPPYVPLARAGRAPRSAPRGTASAAPGTRPSVHRLATRPSAPSPPPALPSACRATAVRLPASPPPPGTNSTARRGNVRSATASPAGRPAPPQVHQHRRPALGSALSTASPPGIAATRRPRSTMAYLERSSAPARRPPRLATFRRAGHPQAHRFRLQAGAFQNMRLIICTDFAQIYSRF